jgi:putative transposase
MHLLVESKTLKRIHDSKFDEYYKKARFWCNKSGSEYAKRLKRKRRGFGDTFFIDEVFIKINGVQHYLWRAVDQDGDVVDVFLQERRDGKAAKGLLTFRKD